PALCAPPSSSPTRRSPALVQGADGFAHKPAPDVVLHAVRALDVPVRWMVGDSWLDVEAGRAAGLRTCAVTWGVSDADRLREARPDRKSTRLNSSHVKISYA